MSGVNKVIILGRLGKDPEIRYMPNGGAVANLAVATSDEWKDKQTGEPKQKTEWHRVSIFGKLAEIAGEYLRKGSNVYLEGSLQTRKWTNQQGQDQFTTEIVVQGFGGVMQMLDGKPQGQPQQQQQQQNNHQGQYSQNNKQSQQQPANQHQQQYNQPQQQQQKSPHQQSYDKSKQNGFQQEQQTFQKQNQQQQQGGYQQQQKVNPQEPSIDFDDDIPF